MSYDDIWKNLIFNGGERGLYWPPVVNVFIQTR